MHIIDLLASSQNRRDEVPNVELGRQIATDNDTKAIAELVSILHNRNKDLQSDSIKVLYEAGALKPELIAPYAADFIALLESKNNRLQWGAMHALSIIAGVDEKTVYSALPKLAAAVDKGSVITRDNYVAILIKLAGMQQYAEEAFVLLNKQLLGCPANQLPTYAENMMPIINKTNKALFTSTLNGRLDDLATESKRKRVEKVLMKMNK